MLEEPALVLVSSPESSHEITDNLLEFTPEDYFWSMRGNSAGLI